MPKLVTMKTKFWNAKLLRVCFISRSERQNQTTLSHLSEGTWHTVFMSTLFPKSPKYDRLLTQLYSNFIQSTCDILCSADCVHTRDCIDEYVRPANILATERNHVHYIRFRMLKDNLDILAPVITEDVRRELLSLDFRQVCIFVCSSINRWQY